MRKIIIGIQLVLVCFLFDSPVYAQSKVEESIAALKNKDTSVRSSAATALGELEDMRAFKHLLTALNDKNESVRGSAAIALGKLKDKRAFKPLLAALKDNNGEVRRDAVLALGWLGDKRAINPLEKLLTNGDFYVFLAVPSALKMLKQ